MIIMREQIKKSGTYTIPIAAQSAVYLVHEHNSGQAYRAQLDFILEPGSSLHYVPLFYGGSQKKVTINVVLQEHARATVSGIYALCKTQEYTINTRQQHEGAHARSDLCINGMAADSASILYQGTIAVQKNAIKTKASQENKTILLSSHAQAVSIPSLEVQTNDVQCAHGSAVGPFDQNHVYYLQSRGLSLYQAQNLMLKGFLAKLLDGTSDAEWADRMIEKLIKTVMPIKEIE